MRKVLVIGQDGMLGGELYTRLLDSKKYEVYKTTIDTLDICSEDDVKNEVEKIKPYFIINCAAYTNVDACETNFEIANNVNGKAVLNIAKAANLVGATLIQISTDYVFDGELDENLAYTEDMQTAPVSNYGITKLLGEKNASNANRYYILRTAWLYGNGKNFARTMLKLSKDHDTLNVVCDQHGTPTSTTTLCDIIEQVMEKEPEYGIYHSTNEGFTTWYEFAKDIFKIKGVNVKVVPVTSDQYPTPTKRPHNSKLSKQKLHNIGIYPKNYMEALKEYLDKEEL